MTGDQDQAFHERLGAALRVSEEQLDELTTARLRAARLRALDAARPARRRVAMAGAAGACAAALLALGVWWTQPPRAAPPLEDLQLLSAGDDLQLLEEIDFYLWLEYGQQELG